MMPQKHPWERDYDEAKKAYDEVVLALQRNTDKATALHAERRRVLTFYSQWFARERRGNVKLSTLYDSTEGVALAARIEDDPSLVDELWLVAHAKRILDHLFARVQTLRKETTPETTEAPQ